VIKGHEAMDYEGARETGSGENLGHLAPQLAGGAEVTTKSTAIPLVPTGENVVVLTEGATLDDIHVQGRDLVVTLDNGQVYAIPDGAVFVPQIVIDGVTVPSLNLAALLTSDEPQPAAGAVSSSGGNFADPVDPLQAAYGLGNLLPYTELHFSTPQREEVLPAAVDREPTVTIVTPNNPAGAVNATD
jgi:hypothetical protein